MNTMTRLLLRAAPFAALLVAAVPSHALYKVVGPDGKVTYTDRPTPTASADRVSTVGSGAAAANTVSLPGELRQPAARYPVTLYSMPDCAPCDTGRQLLRQRGIPFSERQALTGEDTEALQKLAGTRDLPVLTIGPQVARGLAAEMWNSYLDAAGYPRESKLPANYQYPAAGPIVERRSPTARAQEPTPATPPPFLPMTENPSGIKF